MQLRTILLRAKYGDFDDEFFIKFVDNANFVANFLSKRIRGCHVTTDGTYNMVNIQITNSQDSCQIKSVNSLSVEVHVTIEELTKYLKMRKEEERYEFYLSLLEKGYKVATKLKPIPVNTLLALHEEFRKNNYKNERLFKKKQIKEYGIKVMLIHTMTTYDYQLMLYVYNFKNDLLGKGCIYKTLPDEILFDKNVRHLIVEDGKLIVTDFLDQPQFVCQLEDLSKGIVNAVCVDENTKKYIPNDENKEKFERLRW